MPLPPFSVGIPNLVIFPSWKKVTIPYTAIQTAALTSTALVLTLVSKGVVHDCFWNVTTAFSGSGIASMVATVGVLGATAKYLVSSTLLSTGMVAGVNLGPVTPESLSGSTAINLYVTAVGANLSTLTQGSVDVYLLVSVVP